MNFEVVCCASDQVPGFGPKLSRRGRAQAQMCVLHAQCALDAVRLNCKRIGAALAGGWGDFQFDNSPLGWGVLTATVGESQKGKAVLLAALLLCRYMCAVHL